MKKNEEDNSGRKKKVEVLRRSSWVDAVEHVPVSQEQKKMLLWTFFASDLPNDAESLQRNFVHHVEYSLALTHQQLEQLPFASFQAAALVLRDRILGNWKETESFWRHSDAKTVNFFSIEYLLGRSLQSVATNLKLTKRLSKALGSLGISLEEIVEEEQDAGLGNGGLGRLAACFMDSLATLDYPAWAYGLLYSYGMFRQAFGTSGEQIEMPDHWLPSVWVVPRLDVVYPVRFGGTARDLGQGRFSWEGGDIVLAVANDIPIPGFMTPNALSIRLWSSKPCCEFQLQSFNTSGDYGAAIAAKQQSESLTAVLYPSDSSLLGKELRLKQEYFFVAASTKDIWMRFKKRNKRLGEFPQCNAIQLNDSHPALAVAELMRILIDEEGLAWSEAWGIATSTFSYTNHTILPEALETWPVDMLHRLLPRHLKIIFDINFFFLRSVELRWPGNLQKLVSMSIIEEGFPRRVRMSHLAIIGSHAVNGVARLHTDILKSRVFPDFGEFWPEKFINITNGVSPRRWLLVANPPLADLITTTLQVERQWVSNTRLLRGLESFCDDPLFQLRWADVKRQAKERFARFVAKKLGLRVNCRALFDVQVKRFHEYKRQLLNALGCVWRWLWLRSASPEECANAVPRLVIIGGKAAPGYVEAKLVLKFFNRVMAVVNADPIVAGLLQIVVVPDYNVSLAELIIPASDLSQHISLAGTEASGTSNMKFCHLRHFTDSFLSLTDAGGQVRFQRRPHRRNVGWRHSGNRGGNWTRKRFHLWREGRECVGGQSSSGDEAG